MCCPDSIRLDCQFHLVALVCLITVLALLVGHFFVDAVTPATAPVAGPHLHGGFLLPAPVALNLDTLLTFHIVHRTSDISGWIVSPTTPPPLLAS